MGWRQWLVLFSMGVAVIVIELRNHALMWEEHESGQTILTDPMLIWEIIIFGLVLPVLAGVVLGYVGRTAIERDRIARELGLRRQLLARMQGSQSWHELAELLVTTPGNIVSADRSWLLAQRSGEEEFDQIAHWERFGSGHSLSLPLITPAVCERCEEVKSLKGNRITACHHYDLESNPSDCTRYCLWLSSEGMGKTALLFDMPIDHPLDMGQMKMLDDLGDEMSLAIDNANLQYIKQRQVDAAKNERLRIARDLHDTLGQNVSYLRLKLEQLGDAWLASGRTDFQDELANVLAVTDEVYEQVRDTLEELRMTEHRDLEETVRLYATQAAERAGFSIQIHTIGQPGVLSSRRSRQILYIVREALNNVEKHARAQNVDIHLQWSDGEFKLTVRDDGQGFRSEDLDKEDQYGMAIIEERSRAINAKLAIESAPDDGTELALSLPLSSSAFTASRSQ